MCPTFSVTTITLGSTSWRTTAGPNKLDGDVILAGQAVALGDRGSALEPLDAPPWL